MISRFGILLVILAIGMGGASATELSLLTPIKHKSRPKLSTESSTLLAHKGRGGGIGHAATRSAQRGEGPGFIFR
jgi:hypothetical protein